MQPGQMQRTREERPTGGGTLGCLGEVGIWLIFCAIGVAAIFFFERWPIIATIVLAFIGLNAAVFAFLASRATHHGERRWWHLFVDVLIALFATASVLFLVTWGCSCP